MSAIYPVYFGRDAGKRRSFNCPASVQLARHPSPPTPPKTPLAPPSDYDSVKKF